MYTKVARMFNCSWEQIKNIISNRDAIMEFYEATTNPKEQLPLDIRQRKVRFLNECVYEAIQRIHYHMKLPITEELIRLKALELQDYIKLEDFSPNKKWLITFKSLYGISLSNKMLALNRIPPASMDLKDVMAYCTKNLQNSPTNGVRMKVLKQRYSSYDAKNVEYESRRVRKLRFLKRALSEYLHRAKFHYKSMTFDDNALQQVAHKFNDILKVQDFNPTLSWIKEFRQQYESGQDNSGMANGKRPLLSLDLKDILSYCSRMDNKTKACTVTLAPKEPPNVVAQQMRLLPKFPHTPTDSKIKLKQQSPIIYLDEEEEDNDVKPNINNIKMEHKNKEPESSPPLKIRKIESINNDPVLQHELHHERHVETLERQSETITNNEQITIKLESEEREEESVNNNRAAVVLSPHRSVITSTASLLTQPTTSAIQPATKVSPTNINTTHHDEDSALPRQISNFKDVLRLLKPLEEYAMLKENYRAIGLITQLEEVLKNSEDNSTEEDFNT
ncbi:uncharacterized protein isoform X2 [Musca autumnalis]